MNELAKSLIIFGLMLAGTGLILAFLGKVPGLGKLPGDLVFKKGNFVFYFPVVTCLLGSVILTLVFSLFGRK